MHNKYYTNKLLVFCVKTSVSYISYIGPILNQGINDIQNTLKNEKFKIQIKELQTLISKDLKNENMIYLRKEMQEKYFSDNCSSLYIPDQKSTKKDKSFFINYIKECSKNLNTAESCLVLSLILGESASQTVRTKEILDTEVINLLIDYSEQICIDLERTILVCSSLKVLFYHQLSRFLIAVCYDIDGFFYSVLKLFKNLKTTMLNYIYLFKLN
jgi:arginine repressor